MYILLGTHNSATGERPSSLVSRLGTPIARCQKKTVQEQLEAGVRLFDLRVKPYRHATRHNRHYPLEPIGGCTLGHGLCDYDITLKDAVRQINSFGKTYDRDMFVLVTLEGKADSAMGRLVDDIRSLVKPMVKVTLLEVNVKKPVWTQLWRNPSCKVTYTKDYPLIAGWKALLPFPRFWNMFIDYRPQLDSSVFSLRDFV